MAQVGPNVPRLRRLERLIIYSYIDASTYTKRIRLLSKTERELTKNSAIARENKCLVITNEHLVKKFIHIDRLERVLTDFDKIKFMLRDKSVAFCP